MRVYTSPDGMFLNVYKEGDKFFACVSLTMDTSKKVPSYYVKVKYSDQTMTEDEFKKFQDAFDSFANIVKTLTIEMEEK